MTAAPAAFRIGIILSDGASRVSSVFGLKDRPKMAMVLFCQPPTAVSNLESIFGNLFSFSRSIFSNRPSPSPTRRA